HVFSQVNQTEPAFIIHLGDMINPVPELPTYPAAAQNFRALATELQAPLHLMPGNHDIGDKPVTWMPAGMVDGESIALYRQHFGEDFHAFDQAGCHFVIINAPLINSGHPAEVEQRRWLEADLAASSGNRVFLFTNYPLYVSDAGEPESYDNIDEPGRGWLLGLIRQHQPEAVFAAHVHNFWYDRIDATEYYVTPSTCFVRQDYSEMYRIDGGDQKGRNDSAKLGHITVEVYEQGHVAHYHRSYGVTLTNGAAVGVAAPHQAGRPPGYLCRHAPCLGRGDGRRTVRRLGRVPPQASPQRLHPDGALGDGPAWAARANPRPAGRSHTRSHGDHGGRRASISRLSVWPAQQSRDRTVDGASEARRAAGAGCELGRDRGKRRALALSFRGDPAPNHSFTRQPEGSCQARRRPVQSLDQPRIRPRGSRRAN